jgi:hypothetical protein
MNQRKGDVINLKRRHKSFMNKPKTGINAPGQVSFQSDGIMDGLADGLRDGLDDGLRDGMRDGMAEGFLEGSGVGGGALVNGQAIAAAAALAPDSRQQQIRRKEGPAASQFDVPPLRT